MTIAIDDVRRLLKAGDLPGAVRSLRPRAETLPVAELAQATRALAETAGFQDLAVAAKTAAKRSGEPQALYDFGYACVERGVAFLAVAPLREALRLLPDSRPLLAELVSALEDEHRHAEAAALLAGRGDRLPAWPETYLLVTTPCSPGTWTPPRGCCSASRPPRTRSGRTRRRARPAKSCAVASPAAPSRPPDTSIRSAAPICAAGTTASPAACSAPSPRTAGTPG
ncbi:hypothetical protein [Streptomyces sp. NPDC054849]